MDYNYWNFIYQIFPENRFYEMYEIKKGLWEAFREEPEFSEVEDVFDHLIDKRSNGNTKK